MFNWSAKLDQIAKDRCDSGCRNELKSIADQHEACGDHKKIIQTYEEAERLGYLRPDLVLTLVSVNQAILHFRKPLDQVWRMIEDLKPTPKGKVPNKVLVKMMAKRIQEVREIVQKANKYKQDSYRYHIEAATRNNQPIPPPPVLVPDPEFDSIQSLHDFMSQHQTAQYLWELKRIYRKMKQDILVKPELGDQEVREASQLAAIAMEIHNDS